MNFNVGVASLRIMWLNVETAKLLWDILLTIIDLRLHIWCCFEPIYSILNCDFKIRVRVRVRELLKGLDGL